MPSDFLLYGANGFVGSAIAQLAVQQGLRPLIAGRDAGKIEAMAAHLRLEYRIFSLDNRTVLEETLKQVPVVLHCAGPYVHTSSQMVESCLRTGRHYLDITGEIPVYASIASRNDEARAQGVMLLPGVGFDVVPTDCLAMHLKHRLPSATHLSLAFHSDGPANLPPGTAKTAMEMAQYGTLVRRNGRIDSPERGPNSRIVDFDTGPLLATRFSAGDLFTAFYSTGIPNIEVYSALPAFLTRGMAMLVYLRPLFKLAAVRNVIRSVMKTGSTAEERARTHNSVWGEVVDDLGRKAAARLHGPEAGVTWTSLAALGAVKKVLAGVVSPGFQTPALAFGGDFVLECEGVTREDID